MSITVSGFWTQHYGESSGASSFSFSRHQWIHIALVFDRTREVVIGYHAGSEIYNRGFTPGNYTADDADGRMVLGRLYVTPHTSANNYVTARYDDVMFYDRPLNQTEIMSISSFYFNP